LICRAEASGIEIIYDTDDLVFDLRYGSAICNRLRTRNRIEVDYWFAYLARRFAVAERCRRFVSTNGFLDERIKDLFPESVRSVVPNFPTEEQFEISATIRRIKEGGESDGDFLIGYFSGTATHNNDFGMIGEELFHWMTANPRTRLRVVGYLDLPSRFEGLRLDGRIECLPVTDFLSLQRLIAECDLNLAPLVPGVFADCKSELKFFDAALVDTPTVASPTYAFRSVIEHGQNGFLCPEGSWAAILQQVYAMGSTARREVAVSARRDVLQKYAGPDMERKVCSCHGVEWRGSQKVADG